MMSTTSNVRPTEPPRRSAPGSVKSRWWGKDRSIWKPRDGIHKLMLDFSVNLCSLGNVGLVHQHGHLNFLEAIPTCPAAANSASRQSLHTVHAMSPFSFAPDHIYRLFPSGRPPALPIGCQIYHVIYTRCLGFPEQNLLGLTGFRDVLLLLCTKLLAQFDGK